MYPLIFKMSGLLIKKFFSSLLEICLNFMSYPGLKFCKHFHLLNVVNTWAFCRHYIYFYMHKFRINVGYKRKLSNFKIYFCVIKPQVPQDSTFGVLVCLPYIKCVFFSYLKYLKYIFSSINQFLKYIWIVINVNQPKMSGFHIL